MDSQPTHEELCHELTGELADMVTWLADADMTPENFARTISVFEARKLQRFGFKLNSSVSHQHVHFSLRRADSGELCASMDVDPTTGEMTIQHTCLRPPMKSPTPSEAWLPANERPTPPPPNSLFVIGVEGAGGDWNGCHLVLAETCEDGSMREVSSGLPVGFTWTEIDWWLPLEVGRPKARSETHFDPE